MILRGTATLWDEMFIGNTSMWARVVYPRQGELSVGKVVANALAAFSEPVIAIVDTYEGKVVATTNEEMCEDILALMPSGAGSELGGEWTDFNPYSGRTPGMVRDDDLNTSWASNDVMTAGSAASYLAVDLGEVKQILKAQAMSVNGLAPRIEGLGIFGASQSDFGDESEIGYFTGAEFNVPCEVNFDPAVEFRYVRFHPGENWQGDYMDVAELKLFTQGGETAPSIIRPATGQSGHSLQWEIEDDTRNFAGGKLGELCLPQLSKRTLAAMLDRALSLSTGSPFAVVNQNDGRVYLWEPWSPETLSNSLAALAPQDFTVGVKIGSEWSDLIFEGGYT